MRLRGTRLTAIASAARAALRWDLDLDFLARRYSHPVTFSRAGNATMVDSLGRTVWAPAQLCSRGNMDGTWAQGDPLVTNNYGTLPSGRASSLFTWTSASPTSGAALLLQPCIVGQPSRFQVKIKYVNHQYIRVALYSNNNNTNQFRIWVNVQTRTLLSKHESGTAVEATPATVEDIGDGWARVTISADCDWATATDACLLVATAVVDGSTIRAGSGAAVEIGEAVLQQVDATTGELFLSDEYRTAGGPYYGPRDEYHPVTLAPRGRKIEESRTNLILLANVWSPSAGSPTSATQDSSDIFGTAASAFTIQEGGASNYQIVGTNGITYTAAQHSLSAFVKAGTATRCQMATSSAVSSEYANFSLVGSGTVLKQNASVSASIIALADGWFRISMVVTTAAATGQVFVAFINSDTANRLPAYSGAGLTLLACWAQAELGAFPTSLIPTFGAATTRAADLPDAAIVGAASYTLMVDFEPGTLAATSKTAASIFADFNNYTRIIQTATIAAQSGIGGALMTGGTGAVVLTPTKVAVAISPGLMLSARDGALTDTDSGTTFDASAITTLNIGRNGSVSTPLNGWVRKVRYARRAMSAAEIARATAP